MKITVITAVFNRSDTIARCLESVRNQTFKNIQHVIVDGASTDGSIHIINQYLRKNDLFISEIDSGIYDAINKGVINSDGEIICLLHSDDFYYNDNILEEIANCFSRSDIDIIYGDAVFFKSNSISSFVRYYKSGLYSKSRLGSGWMPAHSATFIKRSVYERYGLYKTDYRIASDYEFFCRLVNFPSLNVKYLEKALVCMQLGGVSTSGLRSKITLNFEVMRACRENGISTNFFKILSKYPAKFLQKCNVKKYL